MRRSSRDALELFRPRGWAIELDGDDGFFAMLSRADRSRRRTTRARLSTRWKVACLDEMGVRSLRFDEPLH